MRQQRHTATVGLFGLLLAYVSMTAVAQDKPTSKALQAIDDEEEQLYDRRTALFDDPKAPAEWKQWREVQKQITRQEETARRDLTPLTRKREELFDSPQVQAWSKKLTVIERRLDELRAQKYQLIHDKGESLIHKRHTELSEQAAPDVPQLRKLGFDVLTFPRIDGSTSTQPLAVLIACRAFDMPFHWAGRDERRKDPDRVLFESAFGKSEPEVKLVEFSLQALAETVEKERLAAIINRLLATNASTNQAYVNLIEGKSDIGLLARGPSSDELALAARHGVELEVTPCARDAFVFLVQQQNPIRSLTTAQLRDIYSGRITDWQKVGKHSGPITAYQREENSGSQVLMRSLVMKDTPLFKPARKNSRAPQLIGYLMSSPYNELTSDPLGIGYSVFYYERLMLGSLKTRTLAVDGIEPTFENIQEGRYPFVSDVVVVTRKGLDADAPAARLRNWLLSPEGQLVVKQSGYVPVGNR